MPSHPYGRLLLLPLFLPFSLSLALPFLPPNTHIYNSHHHRLVYSHDDCLQHMFTEEDEEEERETSRRHKSTAAIGNVLHTCETEKRFHSILCSASSSSKNNLQLFFLLLLLLLLLFMCGVRARSLCSCIVTSVLGIYVDNLIKSREGSKRGMLAAHRCEG